MDSGILALWGELEDAGGWDADFGGGFEGVLDELRVDEDYFRGSVCELVDEF